jgi:flagellar biosynthesis protein
MNSEKEKPDHRRAVALHYSGQGAPRVTAKGGGVIADEILRLAREHNIPLYEDAQLASLLARIELGDEIPEKLYVAVAQVIAFAWRLNGRAPGR